MKINLNIIKVLMLILGTSIPLFAQSIWVDTCPTCLGCSEIKMQIKNAANSIDKEHKKLEKKIAKKYNDEILDDNIKKIHKVQVGITKSVARINAMEYEANIDSKKLIFLLRKNKDLYSLPPGSK